jgi:hypothetical protein
MTFSQGAMTGRIDVLKVPDSRLLGDLVESVRHTETLNHWAFLAADGSVRRVRGGDGCVVAGAGATTTAKRG